MLWAANANPCANQEGGGVLNPLWDFLCGFLIVGEGRVVTDSGKQENEKKIPAEKSGHWMKIRKLGGKSGNFAIAIQLHYLIKLTRYTGGFFFFAEILNLMRISIYQNSKLFIKWLYYIFEKDIFGKTWIFLLYFMLAWCLERHV